MREVCHEIPDLPHCGFGVGRRAPVAVAGILTFRSGAYVVSMADWCPDVVTEGGCKNCWR